MKLLVTASVITLLSCAPAVFAQSQTANTPGSQPSVGSQSSTNSSQNLAAANKIKQDLASAGFTDVKVVAESFVVQAKSKDGNPVVMTIGPHGMSVFEAMNSNGPNSNSSSPSGTTGAAPNSSK
jgi:hypothetical protein